MLYTMQADSMSRFFAMTITDDGAPWTAPDGAAYTVRFGAPGKPAGWYDTITEPGGGTHPAVVVDENTVTVEIAEQAVSTPGQNILCVLMTDAQGYQIASWPFVLSVQEVPGFAAPEATVYYNALTAQVAETLTNAQAAAGSANAAAASETAAANSAAAAAQSAQEAASAVTGVVSFNGRQGAVTPQAEDYTAEMVGALPAVGFSTEEVATGQTWIDGKPIYRKTVQCGALPNKSTTITPFDIPDKEIIWIDLSASFSINPTNGQSLPIVLAESNNYTASITAWLGSEDIRIRASGSDRSMFTQTYVTLLYTKTTD